MATEVAGSKQQIRDVISKEVRKVVTEQSALKRMTALLGQVGYGSPKIHQGTTEGKTYRAYLWDSGKLGPVALVAGPQIITEVSWGDDLAAPQKGLAAAIGNQVHRAARQRAAEAVSEGQTEAREAKRFWGGAKEMRPGGASYGQDLPHVRRQQTTPSRVWSPRANPAVDIAPLGSRSRLPRHSEDTRFTGEEFHYPGYTEPANEAPYIEPVYEAPAYEAPSAPDYSGASPQSLLEGVLSGDEYAMAEIRRRLSLKGKSSLRENMKAFLQTLSLSDADQLRTILPAGHAIGKYLPVEAAPVYVAPAPVYTAPVHEAPRTAAPSMEEGRAAANLAAQQLAAALARLGED